MGPGNEATVHVPSFELQVGESNRRLGEAY